MAKSGIYVHIPFCKSRCLYCDFYSNGVALADWNQFVSALLREASFFRRSEIFDHPYTLYLGGGTPSLLPADEFKRLSEGLIDIFGSPEEFTIEVNPDDVTLNLATVWQDAGVSRISMGVQSLNDAELRIIGRRHDSNVALQAFDILSSSFHNISLDLMFGLPGQSLESLRQTVERFINLGPHHISAYSLTFEERSALTRLRNAGKVSEADEELSYAMFEMIVSLLTDAGFGQYEISNFALPGFCSRHNSLYWQGKPYLGLGPGAHSYDGRRTRRFNNPDINAYIKALSPISVSDCTKGNTEAVECLPPCSEELLTDDELSEEMILTRLRCADGLNLAEFRQKFGELKCSRLINQAQKYVDSRHLIITADTIRLTSRGFFISDEIISSLF